MKKTQHFRLSTDCSISSSRHLCSAAGRRHAEKGKCEKLVPDLSGVNSARECGEIGRGYSVSNIKLINRSSIKP